MGDTQAIAEEHYLNGCRHGFRPRRGGGIFAARKATLPLRKMGKTNAFRFSGLYP